MLFEYHLAEGILASNPSLIETLFFCNFVLQFIPWGLAFAGGLLLYRSVNLQTMPWLAAHYIIALFTWPLTSRLMRQIASPTDTFPAHVPSTPDNYIVAAALITERITAIIITILVLSEIAVLASKVRPIPSFVLRPSLGVHANLRIYGIGLVFVTLFPPVGLLIFSRLNSS